MSWHLGELTMVSCASLGSQCLLTWCQTQRHQLDGNNALLGQSRHAEQLCFVRWPGNCDVQKCQTHHNNLEKPHGLLPSLQMLLLAISFRFWPPSFAHDE